MTSPQALVVLPTYNEVENLERIAGSVRERGHAVLVVDDGSEDGTGELADRMASSDPGISVIHRPGKLGLGSAYVQGFQKGLALGHDLLVEMDADGSHRIEHLDAIITAARGCGGIGLGSRYVAGGSVSGFGAHRRFLSWAANVYCRSLLGLAVNDCTSGYRCYTRQVLEAINLERVISDGYSFQIEMVYRATRKGFHVVEVPIHFVDRVAGTSKVSGGEIWDDLLNVVRMRLRRGD